MIQIDNLITLKNAIDTKELHTGAVIDLARMDQPVPWSAIFAEEWSFPYNMTIDFGDNLVSVDILDDLIQFIATKKIEAIGLSFSFRGAHSLDASGCKLMLNALHKGDFPIGFSLSISAENLAREQLFCQFVDVLYTAGSPAWISVDFLNTFISAEHINYLATALEREACPLGISVNIGKMGTITQRNTIFRVCQHAARAANETLKSLALENRVAEILKSKTSLYTAALSPNRHILSTVHQGMDELKERKQGFFVRCEEVPHDRRSTICEQIDTHLTTLSVEKWEKRSPGLNHLCRMLKDKGDSREASVIIQDWKKTYYGAMSRGYIGGLFPIYSSTQGLIDRIVRSEKADRVSKGHDILCDERPFLCQERVL